MICQALNQQFHQLSAGNDIVAGLCADVSISSVLVETSGRDKPAIPSAFAPTMPSSLTLTKTLSSAADYAVELHASKSAGVFFGRDAVQRQVDNHAANAVDAAS